MKNRLVLASALTMMVSGCSEPPPPPEVLRPVRTQIVQTQSAERVRSFSGTAQAGQETHLSFRVAGKIERLAVKVGDEVKKGQLIGRLETRDYELKVQQANANVDQARAASRNAAANLDRIRGLWENDNAAQNDLDAAMATSQSARAQEDSARKGLESAQRQLGYTRLLAPVNGAIASVFGEDNENVQPGQKVVLLTSGARTEVGVAMPESLIAQVREGETVRVTFDSLSGRDFDAIVTEVGVAATSAGTTFPVTVQLAKESPDIRSGMAANVYFRFESQGDEEGIYLPAHAIGEDREGRFVFLLEESDETGVGVVRRTPVTTGSLGAEGLMKVLSGVSVGDRVITAGTRRLTDGQRVKLLNSETDS